MASRRGLASFLAFLAVLGLATAAAGFVEEPPRETFRTAAPLPGDHGVHRLHLVVTTHGHGVYVDASAEAAFHRLPDAALPVEGGLVPVQRHLLEWTTAPFAWDAFGTPTSPWMPTAQQQVEAPAWQVTHHAADGGGLATTVRATDPRAGAWASLVPDGAAPDATVTVPLATAGPCGFLHGLQGRDHDLRDPLVVHGACPPPVRVAGAAAEAPAEPLVLRLSGQDTVDGRRTLVFSTPGDPDALRLWFAADVPYPVRVLTLLSQPAPGVRLYLLHDLVAFGRGGGTSEVGDGGDARAGTASPSAVSPGPSSASSAPSSGASSAVPPAYPWDAPRGRLGPSEEGLRHPFPLSQAWRAALADPLAGFGAWAEDHPDAVLVEAEHAVRADGPRSAPAWRFVASDGAQAREVEVAQVQAGAPLPFLPGGAFDVEARAVDPAAWPAPDGLPASAPSVRALRERHAALVPAAPQGTGATDGSDEEAGWAFRFAAPSRPGAPTTFAAGLRDAAQGRVDQAVLDVAGTLLAHVQAPSGFPAPTYEAAGGGGEPWTPEEGSRAPWAWAPASVGLWSPPEPKTVAVAGGLAALAGLLVLLWPGLKGAGLALFTRFTPDELLGHPTRQAILDLARAEPGIHFQEMARRLGLGRGGLDHHLRKLVLAGHLAERIEGGYACYFPHGALDRRLMAAAPLLKSEGARRVLEVLVARPGLANQEVAAAVGLAPSSVHHHVRRLLDAGLLEPRREGRWLRLRPTALAHDALATYAPAAA